MEANRRNVQLSTGPRSAEGQKNSSRNAHLPEVEIDFAELPDGSLVEMIEDPANPTESLLAVYKDGTVQYVKRWWNGNTVLVPLPRTGPVLKHICLPTGSESHGEMEELFANVCSFFTSCLDVERKDQIFLTAFVLSSWFREKLPVAPYLALLGPPGSGKSTAMRILSLLCRRGLLTSDITSAAFYDVCHRLSPTLLIDETITAGHPRTLLHLLRSSNSPGFVSLRKDRAQMAFGPKVLSWIELPNDPALNSRCIIIPMHRTSRSDLISPDSAQVLKVAKTLRRRLLQFRFENYCSLGVPKVPTDVHLSSRALDLYRALALPIAKNQILCRVLALSISCQRQVQSRLLSAIQASAVRVLSLLIHVDPSAVGFTLSGLTAGMRKDLASRGEPSQLNERKVGDILTFLGLTNRNRTNTGYVLYLQRCDRVRIHEMARDYELDDTGQNENCDICKATAHVVTSESYPESCEQETSLHTLSQP